MTKLERAILNLKPIAFLLNKSKNVYLPGFQGVPLYDVIRFFFYQINKVGLNERAAAISFNFIMAIPAAAIFLFTLVPYLPGSKEFSIELFRVVRDITPNVETRKLIIDFLDDLFNKPKTGLLSLGFVLAMFYSSNAIMGVIRTFDRSLSEKPRTNFIDKRLRAMRLTTIVILLIIGTTLISMGQGAMFRSIMEWLGINKMWVRELIRSSRWIVIVILFLYSIGFIYKFAPTIRKRWRLLSPGAIFATALTILVTSFFSLWVQHFSNYNKFYGSIGTVLIIMLLIFINSLILLIGFELNVSIMYLKIQADERKMKELQEQPQQ
ncbi:MAG: YihY/virulence factor BrkB family protein [Filimonas sp.]|nr:YihY/virulence factor BrkB family protein [Filimonas sp.]